MSDADDVYWSEVAEAKERAAELFEEAMGEQLMRGFLAAGRSDTVRDLVRDLFRAGFTLHDCRGGFGQKERGGVCLVPLTSEPGWYGVTWTQHDVTYHPDTEADVEAKDGVQETMNYALADVLTVLGWEVTSFGQASAHKVRRRPA